MELLVCGEKEAWEPQLADRFVLVVDDLSEFFYTYPPYILLRPHLQDNYKTLSYLEPQCKIHLLILHSPTRHVKQVLSPKACLKLDLAAGPCANLKP